MGNYVFYFISFAPKKERGVPPTQDLSKHLKSPKNLFFFRVFLPALGWSCRTLLHTSVPAYRGFLPEIPLLFGFSGPK